MGRRRRLRRPSAPWNGVRLSAALATAGAVTLAATLAGLGARALRGQHTRETPESLASFAASSVANAARGHVIEAASSAKADSIIEDIETAAHDAILQATVAGTDIVAAAIGAVQGARSAAQEHALFSADALRAAVNGVVAAARTVSHAAEARVIEALRQAEGIDAHKTLLRASPDTHRGLSGPDPEL